MSAKIDWLHHESVTKANFCDTCCHQYSDICGGCETLEGVPVKYSQKPPAIRPMQLDGRNIIAGKLKDDAFEIVRLDNDSSDNPV